jgi:hypothetical protein
MRYSDLGNGVTRDSIAFFREHRHRLAEIVQASVRFPGFDDPHDPYLMVLADRNGDEIALSGCTAGYPGEGPRGAMQVLVECGWPPDQAALVFTTASLRLDRESTLTAPPAGSHERTPRPFPAGPAARAAGIHRAAGIGRA